VEIVQGELRSLRQITARDLEVRVEAHGTHRFSLLGGEVEDDARAGTARFGRVYGSRTVTVVALVWPKHPLQVATLDIGAQWDNHPRGAERTTLRVSTPDGPAERNVELAQRAARLWHARIMTTALEMNEAGDHDKAATYVRRWARRFHRYAADLPGVHDLLRTLSTVGDRVRYQWGTAGHKEAYVMARHAMRFERDMRDAAPVDYLTALAMDEADPKKP
jgi:hypothetical protein